MRIIRTLVVSLVVVGLMAGYSQIAFAAEGARVAPVLDRILAKQELVVGTAASMPPLNMTMKDGQIAGLEIDLVQMFANAMDVKLTLRATSSSVPPSSPTWPALAAFPLAWPPSAVPGAPKNTGKSVHALLAVRKGRIVRTMSRMSLGSL